ncbi:hypothetical protein [Parachlamydia sp. AcF125]|uniref:hypothetical protein n=1 Tax=Parachlamydia sp. AcF125 TaxID=2795736 RepID=UPI001BC9AFC7|nr:hypothetical protein [Parachlamydia sp. AcF125]MBS4168381.1 hypothetical protein [Parachlamydia sp. AcF125]
MSRTPEKKISTLLIAGALSIGGALLTLSYKIGTSHTAQRYPLSHILISLALIQPLNSLQVNNRPKKPFWDSQEIFSESYVNRSPLLASDKSIGNSPSASPAVKFPLFIGGRAFTRFPLLKAFVKRGTFLLEAIFFENRGKTKIQILSTPIFTASLFIPLSNTPYSKS